MNHDTAKLLNVCHSGAVMAVNAIDAILDDVQSTTMRDHLESCKKLHSAVEHEAAELLMRSGKAVKGPGIMARKMAQMTTDLRMAVYPTDSKAATLMTNGCNIGTKMLAKQMNRRSRADVQSRDIARRLIGIEDRTVSGLRGYL